MTGIFAANVGPSRVLALRAQPAPPKRTMNLLIVEDEQFFRDYLRLLVAEAAQKDAPSIFEAATLHDVLAILSKERVDAVLSDGVFPRIGARVWKTSVSGLEVQKVSIKRVRPMECGVCCSPVIR